MQRVHLFPFRTQKLSSAMVKILVWRRTGKITQCQHLTAKSSDLAVSLYSSLAQSVEHLTVNQGVTGSSPVGGAIFVVRKSYNTQKAQDIAYLVLFVLLYLVFLLSDKIFKINSCILALFRKTGLELTSYPFCLIRRPQNVFLRGQVFKFSLFYCYERR